jgi:ferredoxin-type protein NapH
MNSIFKHYRFLIARRVTQLLILSLYISANIYGIKVLTGTLSSSKVLDILPLSDPYALLQMFSAGAIVSFDVIFGALIISFFYALFAGRAFCAWVCPMNIVTDVANWLRRKLSLDRTEKRVWLDKNVRYWVLGLSLILSYMLKVAVFEMVSPIGMLYRGAIFGFGMGFAAVLSIFLFDLFAVKNGWCGHICPLGGFYSSIAKISLLRVKHDQQNCTLCMKCKEICPEKQVLSLIGKESGDIVSGECLNCGRCIEVCEDDALSFGIRNYIKKNG